MKQIVHHWISPVVVVSLMIWFYLWRVRASLKKISRLQGKVVIVTGASSGLGAALARKLYLAGCRLILMSRDIHALDQLKHSLLTTVQSAVVYPPVLLTFDLADPVSVRRAMSQAVNVYGCVDTLINNAGISYRGQVVETECSVDSKLMQVNYLSQVIATKTVLPGMINKRSGRVVFISSLQGRISIPYRSAYAASKHALHAFADCLRAEVARDNVHVTVVAPGYINTRLSMNALTCSGQQYNKMDATTAAGMSADTAASRIVTAIINNTDELLLTGCWYKMAVLLRSLWPWLYFTLTRSRANNNTGNPGS